MSDWIKLHRKIRNHHFYKDRRVFSRYEAWLDLLLTANFSDHKFPLGASVIEVQRGEVITSELKLMESWRWSKAKVRRFIKRLVDERMVIKKADRKKTSLLIINWDAYQKSETTKEPQKDHQETTDDTQTIMNKNEKNEKKKASLIGRWGGCGGEETDLEEPKEAFLKEQEENGNDHDAVRKKETAKTKDGGNGQESAPKYSYLPEECQKCKSGICFRCASRGVGGKL